MKQAPRTLRWLIYAMFFVFAMTTDAVGVVIPEVIKEFGLSLQQASAFHYAQMAAIGFAGIMLGFLADRFGRKQTILLGLGTFSLASFLFAFGSSFSFFILLLFCSGVAVGMFKTASLALIGDLSESTKDHTGTMNTVEGFFGAGAIVGPAIVAYLLSHGLSWKLLYVVAAVLCAGLFFVALFAKFPKVVRKEGLPEVGALRSLAMMRDPYALGFSIAIACYVAAEAAIYVWMPTLLLGYEGSWSNLAAYALTIFFVLRAGGRFLGQWVLEYFSWQGVMAFFSFAIFCCYLGSMTFGLEVAVIALPASGLFMSMIYPTLNARGISCFPKSEHGSVAGLILFFTAAAAALSPLLMGIVGDAFGDIRYGFNVATVFCGILCVGCVLNWIFDPAAKRHATLN